MARMQSHEEFSKTCLEEQKVPKGLRVKVRCNALLAGKTDVAQRFKETAATAENQFTTHVVTHCDKTQGLLMQEIREVERALDDHLQHATPEEREHHEEMVVNTKAAVVREEERLKSQKERKLLALRKESEERQAKAPRGRGNRGRGGNNNRRGRGGRGSGRGRDRGDIPDIQAITEAVLEAIGGQRSEGRRPKPTHSDRQTDRGYQPTRTRDGRVHPYHNRRGGADFRN